MTSLPILLEDLAPFFPAGKMLPFSYNHCRQLLGCAATDTYDVKQTKPCNFQLDVSFALRHQCPCLAEGPGQESVLIFRRYFKTFTCKFSG